MVSDKAWLVGAGPGAPALLTVRGAELLARAELVLHDAEVSPELLALAASAELRLAPASAAELTSLVLEASRAGRRVVRLISGDPLFSASGVAEARALRRAGLELEVVPGVAVELGASSAAGLALGYPGGPRSAAALVSAGPPSPGELAGLARAARSFCARLEPGELDAAVAALLASGRASSELAALVTRGTLPSQRVVTAPLGELARAARAAELAAPLVLVLGDAVRARGELRTFDAQPLFGQRVLVPRPLAQSSVTAAAIRARGAEPVMFPVIEIVAPPDPAPLARALDELCRYDWVLLTSVNGVERVMAALRAAGRDARAFGAARLGVIGPRTGAALRAHGLAADLVADEYVGEGLARALLARGVGRRVLLARALHARDALPESLRAAGAEVEVVAAYETRPVPLSRAAELVERLERGALEIVLFTSSSTVSSTAELLGARAAELLATVTVASIGPVTTETLRARGVRVDVTAEEYTVDGLLDALEAHFRGRAAAPPL
ncbi:MAG: uroporphyrinogen-III synthase [Polyangiaceae bacterium]|nr:uroporphyrinogen-III synthase [Polyangiaceae bacterium]